MNFRDIAEKRVQLALVLARSAGNIALEYFRNPDRIKTQEKANAQDIVSQADREIEILIRETIARKFPDDRVIGEEFGADDREAEFAWVIDPIDGTSPFTRGIPSWCVSIAIIEGNQHVAGIIFAPCTGELYAARADVGATLNDVPIHVSRNATIANGLIGIGASHRVSPAAVSEFVHALLEEGGMFTRNGSGALMLAYVAAGRLAGYYEPHINSWDCLAGLCLVREAGGWTNDFLETYDLSTGGPVVAASPGVRDDLLRLITSCGNSAGNFGAKADIS